MSDDQQKTRVMPAIPSGATAAEATTQSPARPFWRRPWVIGTAAVLIAIGATNGGATDTEEVADSGPAPFSLSAPATTSSAVPPAPLPAAAPTSSAAPDVPAPAAAPATTPAPAPTPKPAPAPAPRPAPAPAPAPVVAPAPAPAPGVVVYANCDDVKAHGAAPIRRGDPGWQQKFDRDNDGVGCES